MSAPRKITLGEDAARMLEATGNEGHLYHHDDVVRELVEALQRIGWHELTDREARDVARAALAKIAQEE